MRDLAAAFQVSEATIRQDLERLETEGQITREHGGAFLNTVPRQVGALALQHSENMDRKRRIGALAAALVKDGETLILDAGSTTTEVALRLRTGSDLTVITTALNIAMILGAVPGLAIHMPGGQFKAPTLSLSGDASVDYFRSIFAGKLFLATAGVEPRRRPHLSELRRPAAEGGDDQGSGRVYLVADSTKINKSSFTRLGALEVVHSFITDDGISDRRRPGPRAARHRGPDRPLSVGPATVVSATERSTPMGLRGPCGTSATSAWRRACLSIFPVASLPPTPACEGP